jgi:hypothetical protein
MNPNTKTAALRDPRPDPRTKLASAPIVKILFAAAGSLACVIVACQTRRYFDPGLARASVDAAHQQWRNANATIDPGAATARGDHRFDHELEAPTRERVAAFVDSLRHAKADLEQYWSDEIRGDSAADRMLILRRIDSDLIAFDQLRLHERDLAWSTQVALRALLSLEESPDLASETRGTALVSRMRALPKYFQGVRDTSRLPWQVQAELAVSVAEFLKDHLESTAARPELQTDVGKAAVAVAREAAQAHHEWLEQRVTIGPQGHHRMQRNLFDALVKAESGLDINANTISELAQAELEGARKKFEALAVAAMPQKEADVDRAISAALRTIAADRPLDAQTLETLSKQAAAETLAFAMQSKIVTIPEKLRVTTIVGRGPGPEGGLSEVETFFSGGSRVTNAIVRVSAPIPVLPAAGQEEWLSALSPARLRIVALTDGAPGEAVLHTNLNSNGSQVRRDIASQGFERGWGPYARRLAIDAGYGANDPAIALASASADVVIAARALCAAKMHAGSMTVADARELFRRQAYLPGEVATIEARRCAADPCVVFELVGRLEIERLVREIQTARNVPALAARDRLLKTGALPFDTLRDLLFTTRSE